MSSYLKKRERERQLEKIRGKKKNGNGTRGNGAARHAMPASEAAEHNTVENLFLSAWHDGEIYKKFRKPLQDLLTVQQDRGRYDSAKALTSWERVMRQGARQIEREMRLPASTFTPATIKAAAKRARDYWESGGR